MLTLRNAIDAIVLGLTLATVFGLGPAFFTLVQTSINRGFKSALMFALGVAANDIIMIILCIMTSVQVVIEGNQFYFGLAAGVVLILYGVFTYSNKANSGNMEKNIDERMPVADKNTSGLTYMMKGFALNILNPFVWLFWLATVALVSGQMNGNRVSVGLFFVITIGISFMCDTLKAYGAAALKRFFNPRRIIVMNKMTGIILMLFGVFFIVKTIWLF